MFEARFKIASANFQKVANTNKQAADLFAPGPNKDSTGFAYMDKLRNKLSSLVVNSNYIWGYIDAPRFVKISEADKIQFERATEKVFDVIQTQSNFEAEKPLILTDFLIGTACFKVAYTQDINMPSRIEYAPLETVYLGNDRLGVVSDVFQKKKLTKNELIDSFGDKVLENQTVAGMQPSDRQEMIEGVIYDYDTKKYHFAVSLDAAFKDVVTDEPMEYNPWVVARAEKMRDSPYGMGPAIKALNEIGIVKSKKDSIDLIGQKQKKPSWYYWGDIRFAKRARLNVPGSVSVMGKKGQNEFMPVNQGINPQIEFFQLEENKQLLNELFYIDFITNIKDIDALKNVTATATQVAVSKFAEQIEPMYSMLQNELLEPVVKKVFECCKKVNLIDITEIEYLRDNTRTAVRFYNAITIAQEQDDLERSNMYIQDILQKLGPQGMAANVNFAVHIDRQKKRFRVKTDEFKTGEDTEKALANMQEQMQGVQQGGGEQ